MSFGFSLGDFFAVGQLAWNVYKSCKGAGGAFEELAHEVIALHTAIKELEDEIENPDSILNRTGAGKKAELGALVKNCTSVLQQLNKLLSKYKSLGTTSKRTWDRLRWGAENLQDIREKLLTHASSLTLFLTTLGTGSLGRIEKKLDQLIQDVRAGRREETVVTFAISEADPDESETQWELLKGELVEDGFSKLDIEAHKNWIKAKLSELIKNGGLHEQLVSRNDSQISAAPISSTEDPSDAITTTDNTRLSKDLEQVLVEDVTEDDEDGEGQSDRTPARTETCPDLATDAAGSKKDPASTALNGKDSWANEDNVSKEPIRNDIGLKNQRRRKLGIRSVKAEGEKRKKAVGISTHSTFRADKDKVMERTNRRDRHFQAASDGNTSVIERGSSDESDDTFLASILPTDSVSQVGNNIPATLSPGTPDAPFESPGKTDFPTEDWLKISKPQSLPAPTPSTACDANTPVTSNERPEQLESQPGTIHHGYFESSGKPDLVAPRVSNTDLPGKSSGVEDKPMQEHLLLEFSRLPDPPKPPQFPYIPTNGYVHSKAEFNLFSRTFKIYIQNWNLYNSRFAHHAAARERQDERLALLGFEHSEILDAYVRLQNEDALVLSYWSRNKDRHRASMREYANLVERLKRLNERSSQIPAAFPKSFKDEEPDLAAHAMAVTGALDSGRQATIDQTASQGTQATAAKEPPEVSYTPAEFRSRPRSRSRSRSRSLSFDGPYVRRRGNPNSYYSSSPPRPAPVSRSSNNTGTGLAALAATNKLRSKNKSTARRRPKDSYLPYSNDSVGSTPGLGSAGLGALAVAGLTARAEQNTSIRRRDSYDSLSPRPSRAVPRPLKGEKAGRATLATAGVGQLARNNTSDRRRRSNSYDSRSPSPNRRPSRKSKTVENYAREALAKFGLGNTTVSSGNSDRGRSKKGVYV